jgi:hypothetical protein
MLTFKHRQMGHRNRYIVTTVSDGTDELAIWADTKGGNAPDWDEIKDEPESECPHWLFVYDGDTEEGRPAQTVTEALAMGFHFMQQNCTALLELNGISVKADSMDQTGGNWAIAPDEIVLFDDVKLPLRYALKGEAGLEIVETEPGFEVARFKSAYGQTCQAFAGRDPGSETDVLTLDTENGRTELTRAQTAALIPLLVNFVQTGTLRPRPWAVGDGPAPEGEAGESDGYSPYCMEGYNQAGMFKHAPPAGGDPVVWMAQVRKSDCGIIFAPVEGGAAGIVSGGDLHAALLAAYEAAAGKGWRWKYGPLPAGTKWVRSFSSVPGGAVNEGGTYWSAYRNADKSLTFVRAWDGTEADGALASELLGIYKGLPKL